MKLSQLVSYLNHLDQFCLDQTQQDLQKNIDPVLHFIRHHDLQFGHIMADMDRKRADIMVQLQALQASLQQLRNEIQHDIDSLQTLYCENSYRLYSQEMVKDSDEVILQRRFQLNDTTAQYIRSRVMRYADWHYPGMIIRPGLEPWIQDLVALDPLYLVDIRMELLTPCQMDFTTNYVQRLRCYTIQEDVDRDMLHQLPKNQMAFVLAYNYFHYKPLDFVRKMLQEVWHCLRPGGTFAFTFNDCDRAGAVELAERAFMCYTPGGLVLAAAEMIGYQRTQIYHVDAACTWVELVKPGTLHSLRGGQSLAKIVAKSQASQ